ncbi:hypothetical protein G6F31_015314 [Rhizopus arrhizus]|nr:hypothetical protein G6F31_015314 [Rhizopus arrhizus]
MRVGQVDLDERHGHRRQRIAQGDRGVGEGGRVDQDESGSVVARGLHAVHQYMLGIGLKAFHGVPGGGRLRGQRLVDVGQRGVAVDLRLAGAEQVEVGAVQDQQLRHGIRKTGKGGSLAEAADAVQLGEVCRVSIDCLKFAGVLAAVRREPDQGALNVVLAGDAGT